MIQTLKGRISLVYFYLVLIIAVIGMIAVINLFQLSNSINGLMTANYKSIKVINHMIENIERQDHAIDIYIWVDSKRGINSFMENQNLFLQAYDIERNNVTEPGEEELVKQLNNHYMDYLKAFSEIQEIKNKEGTSRAFSYYISSSQPKFKKIKYLLKELLNLNEKAMFLSKDRATVTAQNSMYVTLVISLLIAFGSFVAARFFINRFLKPVDLLKETVMQVKAGDLNRQAPIIYQDEIGELAAEFNNMTHRLLQYEQSTIGILMAEKNKSLAIVKSISEPLIVMDRNFRILLINNAGEAIFEVAEGKVLGRHFLEVIKNNELFEHMAGTFETDDESRQKIILLHLKDTDYFFNIIVKIVKDPDAFVNSIVVLFQNITQIKQLEKIKTDFIATVSHEFKTPLTSVIMGLSLLLEEKIGPLTEKQLTTLKAIKEDGETLANLVSDLLEISKVESDKAIFKIQSCSIAGLIENSVKKFLEQAEKQEVHLDYEADEDLPKINADPEKIQWVLNNLMNNALKYTNAGDQIFVTAAAKYNKMFIKVKDTGVGIPQEYLDKLFDKFVQIKGYDLEVRGTGLGLAIAKEIVEAHGGEIWCESRLDAGSTFIFTLPLNGGNKNEKSSSG